MAKSKEATEPKTTEPVMSLDKYLEQNIETDYYQNVYLRKHFNGHVIKTAAEWADAIKTATNLELK